MFTTIQHILLIFSRFLLEIFDFFRKFDFLRFLNFLIILAFERHYWDS